MNQKTSISILMPVKNTASFLKDCLDSIINQTEKNFELIAVDDHSTDECYTILSEYSTKDSRFKVFKNSGSGIIEALRLAYSKSTGEVITRMDSDDIMSLDKLKVLKTNLENFGLGYIALGKVKYFSEKPLGDGFKRYEEWLNSLIEKASNFEGVYKECVIPSPCWMVYREDLEKCNVFYPNDYPEDYDLAFRFYEVGLKPISCNTILHHWRDYATRTSRTHKHYADHTFLDIKMKYFLKLDYDSNKNLVVWGAGDKGKTIAKNEGNGPKRSILILHVTGEEIGLYGSKYYTENPLFPLVNTVANLNVDMIGRIGSEKEGNENYIYLIGSDKLSQGLHDLSEAVNEKYVNLELDYTYNDDNDPNRFYYRSDHYNFAKNNIPVIFYFNGTHADYHKPTDTPEKINYELLAKRSKLIFLTAWEIANQEERITVDK